MGTAPGCCISSYPLLAIRPLAFLDYCLRPSGPGANAPMSASAFFLNGPGANLYGLDPSGVYGTESLPQIEARCRKHAASLDIVLDFRQSNHEGELIDWIQEARRTASGLIINGAGLTYTSIALLDALLAFGKPIIEVHMSNIYRREPFRHRSFISKAATGIVAGLGPMGYELAITAMARLLADASSA